MAFSANVIANQFVELALAEESPLQPMKLQKLVYYAQGWHLGLNKQPIFNEQVEAWKYGPVVRVVYHTFKEYRDSPITELKAFVASSKVEEGKAKFEVATTLPESEHFAREFIKRIWDIYKRFSGTQLSNMTHAVGTPWHTVYTAYNGEIPKGTAIPHELLTEYFAKEAERNKRTYQ